jgi:hypothetical protein
VHDGLSVLQLERRARPIRIGFDLDVTDSVVVREAIELSTTQWGGMLFPFIPNFTRRPRWWLDDLASRPTATDIRAGFVRSLKPDYRIPLPGDSDRTGTFREVTYRDLTTVEGPRDDVLSGLPGSAIYRYLWERDAKFLEREGARVVEVVSDQDFALLAGACFGTLPRDGALADISTQYARIFRPDQVEFTPAVLLDGLRATARNLCFGPLQIGSYGLRFRGDVATAGTHLLLLDHSRPTDVADFWNLRALGRRVVPLPLVWLEELLPQLSARLSVRGPDDWGDHAYVIAAQRVERDLAVETAQRLNEEGLRVVGSSYPHFWRDRGLDAASWEVIAEEDRIEAPVRDGRVHAGLLAPPAAEYYPSGIARWISVISVIPWALPRDGSVAGFIPPDLGEVSQLLGAYTHLDVRATDEGLAVPTGSRDDTMEWTPPSGRDVIAALLGKVVGGDPQASQPGLIAEELIRRVGGLHFLPLVQYRPLLELLEQAALADIEIEPDERDERRRPRTGLIPRPKLLEILNRRARDPERALRGLRALVARGVLTSGPGKLLCPECTHRNWYSVADLGPQLVCARCLRQFAFPHAEPPGRSDWAYRPVGAFSFPDYAAGSYTVAFALAFLTSRLGDRSVWSTNLNLRDDIEVDFAVVISDESRVVLDKEPITLLGEAKTDGRFQERDFARLRELRRLFPRGMVVVATLREKLTSKERAALANIAQPKHVGRPWEMSWDPPMMILTATELLSGRTAPDCWKDAGGTTAEIATRNRVIANDPEVRQIADLTAQMHLGLPPHHEWVRSTLPRTAKKRRRSSRN